MWTAKITSLKDGKVQHYTLHHSNNNQQLQYSEVIELWANSSEFRAFYNQLLADSPFQAFFWETPPLTLETLDMPFEFVLIESISLARRRADIYTFEKYYKIYKFVVDFPNLGRNAQLVVPCPVVGDLNIYTHLAVFVRNAPTKQTDALWESIGLNFPKLLNRKRWLNTSGLGVSWLHIRFDTRPKYYQFNPYRNWA